MAQQTQPVMQRQQHHQHHHHQQKKPKPNLFYISWLRCLLLLLLYASLRFQRLSRRQWPPSGVYKIYTRHRHTHEHTHMCSTSTAAANAAAASNGQKETVKTHAQRLKKKSHLELPNVKYKLHATPAKTAEQRRLPRPHFPAAAMGNWQLAFPKRARRRQWSRASKKRLRLWPVSRLWLAHSLSHSHSHLHSLIHSLVHSLRHSVSQLHIRLAQRRVLLIHLHQ